jgi:predicted NBD/HSP70 family sugar kinase
MVISSTVPMRGDSALPPGGSQRSLRDHNSQRVMSALERLGPSSQAELARATGLSRATVNNIVKRLNDRGVLSVSAGNNARSTKVARRAAAGVALAFEVGHQHIAALAVSVADRRRAEVDHRIEREHSAKLDIEWILDAIPRLLDEVGGSTSDLLGLTLIVHAPLDGASGFVSTSAGLRGWAGADIRALFDGRLAVPLRIENDVNAAALAERRAAPAAGDFAYVKVSEGLGASLMVGGELYRGPNGMAGQISHLSVDERGPLCACGNRGCLSAVASGQSLLASLHSAGREFRSVTDLVAAAEQGDPMCGGVLTEAARNVGLAVSHLIKVTGMQSIVVGGEMAASERFFLAPMRRTIETQTLRNPVGSTQVTRSALPLSAALLGGVQLVVDGAGGFGADSEWLLSDPAPAAAVS